MKLFRKKSKIKEIEEVWKPKKNDPLGSYTGMPLCDDDRERPVQDADDL